MSALGVELKINVHVEPIEGVSMSEYDFTCTFFTYKNKAVVIPKNKMSKIDNDNYIAVVDTSKTGAGCLKMKFEADIPDDEVEDGFRKEVELVDLNIPILAI